MTHVQKLLFLLGLSVLTSVLSSFTATAQKLPEYVNEALANNKVIKQQNFQLEKSLLALKEAQTYFLPAVTLHGSYVKSQGGRTIDFPIGDLLNPVYNSLNSLTESAAFSEVQNQSIQLNPNNFYDVKFRTTLPLINAEILINKKIKKELITFQQATLNIYMRQLIKDVKAAYYQFSQADKAVEIYTNALTLVNENIRMNESLLRNGTRNGTALTRAKSEKERIQASINEAVNNRKNAQAYFNFLLNKAFDEPINIDSAISKPSQLLITEGRDVLSREELQQVKSELFVNEQNKRLQQSYLIPKLSTSLDLGSQGNDFQVNNQSKYFLWGVNLQWDLFAGGQHTYKTRQAEAEMAATRLKQDDLNDALTMQLEQTVRNYNTAVFKHKSASSRLSFAKKYYADQLKVYKEGQLLYIELLDAQNQITQASLEASIADSEVQIAAAELERCQASFPL